MGKCSFCFKEVGNFNEIMIHEFVYHDKLLGKEETIPKWVLVVELLQKIIKKIKKIKLLF
jgi:hypothetical protein